MLILDLKSFLFIYIKFGLKVKILIAALQKLNANATHSSMRI